jgi:hypothetical protein
MGATQQQTSLGGTTLWGYQWRKRFRRFGNDGFIPLVFVSHSVEHHHEGLPITNRANINEKFGAAKWVKRLPQSETSPSNEPAPTN